ncbi:squalene--hopene cyclase [Candidatus Rariloculus sp.]|uniref:squalene--hopene cyclase n=1 Tax=Candidatus Rariloculus sp. TaxID=3101265 RepID=UPI003D0D5367
MRTPQADIAVSPPRERQPLLDQAIATAMAWLDRKQTEEGFWVGMLESSYCIEAEWLLAMHFLGYDHPRKTGLVAKLLAGQRPDGAWESYYEAPSGDINSTVECYAALRCAGMPADAEPLVRARQWISTHGGLRKIRVFTRYWLALIGEWPWDQTPNLPPEIIANPKWFPFNIYNFSSWARATLLPLAVLSAHRPVRPLPADRRLDELFPDGRDRMDYRLPHDQPLFSFKRLFLVTDRLLHWYQNVGLTPGRKFAIKPCLEWIVRHQDADGAWGGIQPPWIYSLMALNVEGYPLKHPVIAKGLSALDAHWSYERDGSLHIQASESPVWDTWLSLLAMRDCERDFTPGMQRALDWLLDNEVTYRGDWAQQNKHLEPGGWTFERSNFHYPDIDDTAVALCVLARLPMRLRNKPRVKAALDRAVTWTLGMQSSNGGWASFDRNNDKLVITMIPFSDFGEALDPPSADVTAHVIEALALLGYARSEPAIEKAYRFLREEQEHDGPWFGRWGVNYIYGTAAVLPALAAIGEDMRADYVRRAAEWLVEHQNSDGGWGETCASYMDEALRGQGPSTASQTAWSLIALLATGNRDYGAAVRRGLAHLIETQREDGTWDELHYTGTGFPGYGFGARIDFRDERTRRRIAQGTELQRGFMINYNLYRHYFPLMAMGRARNYFRGLER